VGDARQIGVARELGVEDKLRDSFAVAKIDKHAATMVAIARNPAKQNDDLVRVGLTKLAAMVRPLQLVDESSHFGGTVSRARSTPFFESGFSSPSTVTCRGMNASTARRTEGVLRAVCAAAPALLAASHVPNVADAAHDRGAFRVLGLHPQPWRSLDVAVGALLAPLPLGTLAARAALGGALVGAAAGVLLFDIACRLVRARLEPDSFGYLVAAIATSAALVGAPWQLEIAAVGSSVTGATLVLLCLSLTLRASESPSPRAWMAPAAALGLAMGQEPSVLASAIAGSVACAAASEGARASLVRAWRESKVAIWGSFAAGLAPLFLALVRVRMGGSLSAGTALDGWVGSGSSSTASPLAFARQELGPVLALLAVAGGVMAALSDRARGAAAGLAAIVVVGALCGSMGAPMGPTVFAAPVLAACAAMAALAAVSMLAIVRAVATARVPLARTAAALFVVLELVWPVEAADEGLVRSARGASGAATFWDDAAWGTLEPRAVVLIDDERVRERADAANAQALVRSDIVIVGSKGQSGPRGGPFATDLVPLWRDLALSGAPTEASISALSSVRPLAASYDPAWGLAIGKHLVPMAILDKIEPEPRAASDRRRALDAFATARQELHVHLAGDAELCAVTSSLLRARFGLLASLGERDLAERAASDAQTFERP